MTTTELIGALQALEKGASGRSREISFYIGGEPGAQYVHEPEIEIASIGDGIAGASICLRILNT